MGRKLGSKNKGVRAKARSAYDTYSYWYDKYTKGEKAGWFRPKLNKQEFDEMYDLAKKAGIKTNRARTIAASQEYVDRNFEKKYKELFKDYPPKVIYISSGRINCARNGDFDKYKNADRKHTKR